MMWHLVIGYFFKKKFIVHPCHVLAHAMSLLTCHIIYAIACVGAGVSLGDWLFSKKNYTSHIVSSLISHHHTWHTIYAMSPMSTDMSLDNWTLWKEILYNMPHHHLYLIIMHMPHHQCYVTYECWHVTPCWTFLKKFYSGCHIITHIMSVK